MDDTYALQLARLIAPALKEEVAVQPMLPLQIKLHLERMKLMELIRAAHAKKPRSSALVVCAQAEVHAAC